MKRQWKARLLEQVSLPVFEVDAHNVVPCWQVSDKQEYSAATFRPKLQRRLPELLEPIPELEDQGADAAEQKPMGWAQLLSSLQIDTAGEPLTGIGSGPSAANEVLGDFLAERIHGYAARRNDPNSGRTSLISPYLHFGQLSAQRAALAALDSGCDPQDRDAFLEQLLVRRELSDNHCWYNAHYDRVSGLPSWSQRTLEEHRHDARPAEYPLDVFEEARTDDPLWNAAQREMVRSGRMHGYMRMYWAKKMLEWSRTPEQAVEWAIYLNDRYELDGRDPNGYAGILWAVGGLHDRPFKERPIYGKVRYMNDKGCARKFDVQAYIRSWS
jgi:deoxyribodipyrimidine photo-lyase